MKKFMTLLALIAIPFAMQAQTKFHDVEANEAKGPVKSITTQQMGRSQTITFTADGKQEGVTDAVYDADGYIQSAKVEAQGQKIEVKYTWENGKVKSRTMNMMGREFTTVNNYDENGVIKSTSMDMGGQNMEIPYTDYKFDDKGNWISRKTSMMGREMEMPRTIEYFE